MTPWTPCPFDIDYTGFVYRITNLQTKKYYIGRKNFHSITHKKIKGKARRQTIKVESDWKTYLSSCNALKADIDKLGIEAFSFEILSVHSSLAELKFTEALNQWKAKLAGHEIYNGRIENITYNQFSKNRIQFVPE